MKKIILILLALSTISTSLSSQIFKTRKERQEYYKAEGWRVLQMLEPNICQANKKPMLEYSTYYTEERSTTESNIVYCNQYTRIDLYFGKPIATAKGQSFPGEFTPCGSVLFLSGMPIKFQPFMAGLSQWIDLPQTSLTNPNKNFVLTKENATAIPGIKEVQNISIDSYAKDWKKCVENTTVVSYYSPADNAR